MTSVTDSSHAHSELMTDVFKCFGHPLRLRILDMLVSNDEVSVGEFLDELGVEPSHLSHQLTALRHQRLVAADRHGNQVSYRLTAPEVAAVLAEGRSLLAGLTARARDIVRASADATTGSGRDGAASTGPSQVRTIAPVSGSEGLIA